jgi:hypothetical protein
MPVDRLNLVVARYRDGTLVKGVTYDFSPAKTVFHIQTVSDEQLTVPVSIPDLKAVFFVKSLEGFPEHKEEKEFPGKGVERRIRVEFFDGEVILGTTTGFSRERQGFFLFPADPDTNNLRIYVVSSAVKKVEFE